MKKKILVILVVLVLCANFFSSFSFGWSFKPRLISKEDNFGWEQVVDHGFGDPDNLHAWAMKKYKSYLYVGTRNVVDGCQVYRSISGDIGTWEQVNIDGFGNENKSEGVRNMIVYKDLLWIITNSWEFGTQVWITNGEDSDGIVVWKKANLNGFGEGEDIISSRGISVFQDKLFVGSQSRDGHPLVFRYDGPTSFNDIDPFNWTMVRDWFYDPDYDPDLFLAGDLVNFTSSDGMDYLYVVLIAGATPLFRELRSNFSILRLLNTLRIFFFGKSQIWRFNGEVWEKIDTDIFLKNNFNVMGCDFQVFNGSIYIGTANWFGGEIWKTEDGINWTRISKRGFYRPFNFWMWQMHTYKDRLIIGTFNPVLGCEVWVSTNDNPMKQSDFNRISKNGIDGSNIFKLRELSQDGARSFETFNGSLYVGTTNWVDLQCFLTGSGCEVWRIEDIPE